MPPRGYGPGQMTITWSRILPYELSAATVF